MKRAWLLISVIAVVAIVRHRGHRADRCALEQTWTAGDVHQYENLVLSPDHHGHWDLGSYDQEIQPDAQDFTWAATGTTLDIIADDGSRREVRYTIEPMRARCVMSLDTYPLPRSHEYYWYTDGL